MEMSAASRLRAMSILIAACVVALGLLLAAFFVERQNDAAWRTEQHNRVRESLMLMESRLEGNLRSDILLVRGLVSVVAAHPQLTQEEFARAAGPLFEGQSQLRNIGAAPDMVIRFMYPLAGNEAAIGLDYRSTPSQRDAAELARRSGDLVLAGPLSLAQGGTGLIGRVPVFLASDDGAQRFWGLISAVIDAERLYRDSGLLDPAAPIEVALRGRDATGSSGPVFFGDAALFGGDVVTVTVPLPSGSWQMAARPRAGWSAQAPSAGFVRLGFLLAAILIVGPLLLLAMIERDRGRAEARLQMTLADLEEARVAAEAGSRAKSEFLATMSHELRTPLNGVLGMAELLTATPLDAEQKEYVHTLRDSGHSLLHILNDILDFSRIEAGRITLVAVEFDLGALVGEVCDLLRPRAEEKGLALRFGSAPDLPDCLRGDALRIRQVLVNLVGNAIKFTPAGSVAVELDWRPTDAGQARVRVAVRDTGIGIPLADQARLFDHFTQADPSITRRFGGTGLGLSIARRLVEAMGGEIGVDSTPGAGACFWFELPLAACPAAGEA